MKTLLALLKKDFILFRRNKLWSFLEVLVPVVLLVFPLFLMKQDDFMGYKKDQEVTERVTAIELKSGYSNHQPPHHCDQITYKIQKPPQKSKNKFRDYIKEEWKTCNIISGIYNTSKGIELIGSATTTDVNQLHGKTKPASKRRVKYVYEEFIRDLYEAMNQKISNSLTTQDDELNHLRITDPGYIPFTFFQLIPILIAVSMTFPVINTARSIVVEKATIEPYLHSIGLSRAVFHLEHFVFAFLKMTVLVLAAMSAYCIKYTRFQFFWLLIGIFVYILASISFAMLMSAFFSKPRRAVEATLVIWIGSFVVPILLEPTGWPTIPASLNINQALKSYFLAIEPHFVNGKDGMTFMDGFEQERDNQYACIVYLGIMFFDFLLMAFGSVFLSKIVDIASSFLVKTFWKKVKHVKEKSKGKSVELGADGTLLGEEAVDGRKNAASDIQLDNLVKIYSNGETAVNGLSMRAIRGQVSVLLGHNGCGKSTTFGMITGITQPTTGTITIGGIDAVAHRSKVRKLIGYCPQYNPLYDKLTVIEHLKLVNALKGASWRNSAQEAETLLVQIGLVEKKKTLAKNLSGGMKRKLCVCMALIGGSRVVLLDEPTAGMDPGARQDVQKMLNQVKAEKTILLTTHYMDEADKLGDWVFVMSHGKMAASGSSVYLKKKYGDGYVLTVVLDAKVNSGESIVVTEKICKLYVKEAVIKDHRGQMVEISFPESRKDAILPLLKAFEAIIAKQYSSNSLGSITGSLSKDMKSLNIVTMGLSMSSLEQAFIKVEKECDRVLFGIDDKEKRAKAEKNFIAFVQAKNDPRRTGISLILLQYCTILYKRLIHVYRNLDQLILQLLVPLAGLCWIIIEISALTVTKDSVIADDFSLSVLPACKVVIRFEEAEDVRIKNYLSQFKQLEISTEKIGGSVLDLGKTGLGLIISKYKNRTVIHYVDTIPAALPVAMVLLVNLKSLRLSNTQSVGSLELSVQWMAYESMDEAMVMSLLPSVLFYITIAGISFVIIPAILFLVEEKVTKFQHQQRLSGISPIVFWTGCVLWDFLLYFVVATYLIVLLAVYGFLSEYLYLSIPIYFLFFFSYTSFVYFLSVFVKTPAVGSTILTVHRVVTLGVGLFLFLFFLVLGHAKTGITGKIKMLYIFGLIDVGFVKMYALSKIFASHSKVVILMETVRREVFGYAIYEFMAIWIDMLFLLMFAILFFFFFVALRSRILRKLWGAVGMAFYKPAQRYGTSKGGAEAASLLNGSGPQGGRDVVVVQRLVKYFGKMRAVNHLSITVKEKECFGLLGQNGAGKTTTFDMLTGLTIPSGGTALVGGVDISRKINIGYCPQFDAMMGQYSGRQILRIMARLQGYRNCSQVVEMVLVCVGMTEHGDKLIQNCSGGQKRKISVGIALISRAPCVMLDEPTAGIDPRARRDIWDTLHCMREKANMSIVLTSHSMEECEALCTRIGVLRKGDMVALGTSQELKSTYGNFFLLTMVLKDLKQVENIKKEVSQKWKDAVLKTEPNNASLNMVYQLPKTSKDKWSEVYTEVTQLAIRLHIDDFMLTQATLEDAFIRLNADKIEPPQ